MKVKMIPSARSPRPSQNFARSVKAGGALTALILAVGSHAVQAQSISIPNYSFESQLADPLSDVTNNIDSWQKSAQPVGFTTPNGYTWDQQSGIFGNTPVGYPNHINNADGFQSAYLFDVPGVAIFQDYNSTDWQNQPPTHGFNATFDIGKSYTFTLGVIAGGGNMQPGAVLDLILYYRDGSNNIVPIADTPITFTTAAFPTTTDLIDYSVSTSVISGADAAAGQNIGVELLSSQGEGFGYWDVDNARLTAAPEPTSAELLIAGLGGLLARRRRQS